MYSRSSQAVGKLPGRHTGGSCIGADAMEGEGCTPMVAMLGPTGTGSPIMPGLAWVGQAGACAEAGRAAMPNATSAALFHHFAIVRLPSNAVGLTGIRRVVGVDCLRSGTGMPARSLQAKSAGTSGKLELFGTTRASRTAGRSSKARENE